VYHIHTHRSLTHFLLAVIFTEDLFNFTIRTNLTYLPQSNSGAKFNPFAFLNQDIGDSDHYLSSGVCTLQQAVALSLLEYSNSSGNATNFSLGVKELPTPEIIINSPSAILVFISPLVLLGFIPSFLISLVEMVSEKAAKTKEYMKMMGLPESVYTVSWIISSSLPIFFLTTVFVIANYSTGVFHHSSVFFVVLFFFSFALSVVAFVFLSASICDSTRTCILTGGMWLYAVNSFALFVPSVSVGWQYVLSLLAPLNFTLGFFLISTSEGNGEGIDFDNDVVMGISLGHLTLVMLLDTLIYSLLAWYIQNVRPGEWGIPKPLAFPLMPSYWKSVYESIVSKKTNRDGYIELPTKLNNSKGMEEHVEDPADHLVESVRIQNLTKVFGDLDRPAVNNLSLSLYQGEIHVLLGHNGAGKSTTISMLTGLLPPTSGGALIEGFQLPEQIEKVREIIGVCLQQDILWDKLSALEHLRFFAHLKGVPEKDIDRSVESLLSGVGLERGHWDKPTLGFSGGMKRKVSLAIALIGDSKVVLLDEPTTGMDPVSRRFMYNFLAEAKKDRVIILTTHYMEEAEVLGDRSTIIAHGRLQCSGSGVFLKNKFGVGYFLNIIKNQSSTDSSDIRSLVKRHVFNAVIRSETPQELFVLLPTSDTQAFPALFEEFEELVRKNRITDFNISMTTLEDVFLKIASREEDEEGQGLWQKQYEEKEAQEHEGSVDNYCSISITDTSPPGSSISRRQIIFRQLFPLIRRRFLNVLRSKELLMFLVLTPIISICLTSFAFKYTEYLVNQGVFSDNMVVPLVMDLNVTSIPIVDLTNGSEVVTNLLSVLGDLTDPSLVLLESTVSELEQMVLSAYNNTSTSIISGGYVFDQQEILNDGGRGGLNVTIFYNQSVTMSLPAYVNQIHNTFLQEVVSNNSSLFFTTNIHALPGNSPVVTFSSISVSIFISLSLLLSIFGRDIVVERVSDLKWQLLLGSMDIFSYWISNFIADFLLYMIPVTISWIILRLVGDDAFVGRAFPALAILTIFFTISALLSQYVLSYLLQKPDNALGGHPFIPFFTFIFSSFLLTLLTPRHLQCYYT
jgi:ATP-binding cassette subfamily A (ABC1) protein 3